MRIVYYQGPRGNFGDDLNKVLWRELLPPTCFEAEDAVLLGIGSIFREEFLPKTATENKRVFILGSGAGTGPLPKQWPNPRWSVLAVRGPLTGRLIGLPETAVTDSAALLPLAKKLFPSAQERKDIVFFPHYNSVEFSRWEEVCALAGMVFADAHRPPQQILGLLSRARLVITEAMHGAIVADAMRIPWIPVVCSPAILPFKWVDWTSSVSLNYQPLSLPPSSAWEALKHLKIRVFDRREARHGRQLVKDEDLIADFFRRFSGVTPEQIADRRKMNGSARNMLQRMARRFDRVFMERAADALGVAAKQQSFLSSEKILSSRIGRLGDAVARLQRALAA